jgi:hypothetical protein
MTPNPQNTQSDPEYIGKNGQKRIPLQGMMQQLEDSNSKHTDEQDKNLP